MMHSFLCILSTYKEYTMNTFLTLYTANIPQLLSPCAGLGQTPEYAQPYVIGTCEELRLCADCMYAVCHASFHDQCCCMA